jgi:hypothetical protein
MYDDLMNKRIWAKETYSPTYTQTQTLGSYPSPSSILHTLNPHAHHPVQNIPFPDKRNPELHKKQRSGTDDFIKSSNQAITCQPSARHLEPYFSALPE